LARSTGFGGLRLSRSTLAERCERAAHPALHSLGQIGPQPGGRDNDVDRAHAAGPFDAVLAVELVGDLAKLLRAYDRTDRRQLSAQPGSVGLSASINGLGDS